MAIDEACGHLLALRAVLGAAIFNVDAALRALGDEPKDLTLSEPAVCTHPPEARVDMTPGGDHAPRWYCRICNTKGGAW